MSKDTGELTRQDLANGAQFGIAGETTIGVPATERA